jgi:iron complex outermembrane recepter protein
MNSYGPSNEFQGDNGDEAISHSCAGDICYYNNRIGTIPITNLELGLEAAKGLKIAVGDNNLFNCYPAQINPMLTASYDSAEDNAGVQKYPTFSPFGIDGGFYYGRISYRF